MKILVIKNRALGDAILTLGAIQYLSSLVPEAKITYAVPGWVEPLFSDVKCAPVRYVALPKGWKQVLAFINWMRNEKFDYVLDFHQRTSSGRLFKFLSYLLDYGYFYHNHHHKNPGFVLDQGIIKPNIQRDLDLAWSFAKNLLLDKESPIPNYLDWEPRITAKVERVNQVVIGIVATRQTKMWPLENYAKLIGLIRERNCHCRIVIPLSSSLQDKLLEKLLREFEPSQHVEFLYLPLRQLPFEIAKSRLYIGNDTGLKHLAVALGVSTFTFFGPEEPMEWHPYDLTRHQVFFEPVMPCRYDKAHFCGLDHCDHLTCLRSLSVEMVWDKIKALI